MTPQQKANVTLAVWQSLRHLSPEARIERLMSDFFLPPIEMDIRYQDQLKAVAKGMAE